MVSPIKSYKKDPMGLGRGAGDYYIRSYKGNKEWYSKYDETRDYNKDSKKSEYADYKYRHAGDNEEYVTSKNNRKQNKIVKIKKKKI